MTKMNLAEGALISEVGVSRDTVTIASGQNLAPNTVVAQVAASGEYVQLDPAGADGSEVAAGVLTRPVDASSAAAEGVVFARVCEVNDHKLIWPAGITAGEKATAVSQLADAHVIVRS